MSPRPTQVLFVVVLLACLVTADDKYTTKFDGIDVEAVLKNERILRRYVDCVLDKGPCTAEGRELKKRIPDAVQSECSKCSEVQKRQARRVLEFLIQKKPHYWEQLAKKYDPDGNLRKRHGVKV
uniref:Chemosensory protein 12 n=1 Tax=Matsumurasca onukii TaxID=2912585 RepID=A0A343WH07_MATON|nr:chemosensory protein 12 [Matsumurasca onukii]